MPPRLRALLVFVLCLVTVFGGPVASSYAADEACMSQMADHGDAPVTQDCDGCGGGAVGHMQHDCCFFAAGVALPASAASGSPATAPSHAISGAPPGYRSVAFSPGLQPPR